jgi:hypothetical protein
MLRTFLSGLILATALATVASADSLYGTIKFRDGSKDKGTTSVKTDWNGNKAKLDGRGGYKLDFGGKVGKKVIVYVEGKKYTEIEVKGDVRLDITRD